MTNYQITVRHGSPGKRYFMAQVSAADVREALRQASAAIPDAVAVDADLVEVRPAPDPEAERPFMGEATPEGQGDA